MESLVRAPEIDYARQNEEVKRVWDSYYAGHPIRVPVRIATEPRIWIQDPSLNTKGVTWKAFYEDADLMFDTYLQYVYYIAHALPHDAEMGIPEKEWLVQPFFNNVVEESWYGCPVHFPENQVPLNTPVYRGARKEALFDRGIPEPFSGMMGTVREFYERFVEKCRNYEFHGRPVTVFPPNPITPQGVLTAGVGICGADLLEDMLVREDYYHRVMDFITTATIERVRAWRAYLGLELKPESLVFADDATQLVSARTYREKVLPYHRRLLESLAGKGPHSIHLCGNVQRHFPAMITELNVKSFDTGFPINFSTLRDEVGEDVEILGGVPATNLLAGTPAQVYAMAMDILKSGIMRGGKFILKEANNLPPLTPRANLDAMYRAAKDGGVYPA